MELSLGECSEHVPHVSLEVVSQRADVHAPVVFDF